VRDTFHFFQPEPTHTLISAIAKPLPRQILGPSRNVRRCRCPCSSLALPILFSSSHLSGLKESESSPQKILEVLMVWMGMRKTSPLLTVMLFTLSPLGRIIGDARGTTSSRLAWTAKGTVSGIMHRPRET
jgi:hypothetical protein